MHKGRGTRRLAESAGAICIREEPLRNFAGRFCVRATRSGDSTRRLCILPAENLDDAAATLPHCSINRNPVAFDGVPGSCSLTGSARIEVGCNEWVRAVIEVDVVLVNMEEQTAYCSDGITRDIFEMYDADAKPTQDPDLAIAAVVKVGDDQFILLNLTGEDPAKLH
jgi:hypothetical protein